MLRLFFYYSGSAIDTGYEYLERHCSRRYVTIPHLLQIRMGPLARPHLFCNSFYLVVVFAPTASAVVTIVVRGLFIVAVADGYDVFRAVQANAADAARIAAIVVRSGRVISGKSHHAVVFAHPYK